MGFSPFMFDESLTYDKILNVERDIDLSMVIDKLSRYRRERMEIIDNAFPDGHFYGRGWKRGYLPMGEEVKLLQRTRIGLNIHNSTGPINTRLYYLPANGVLQICDNKSHLGKVFELGKEVVGFDDIKEVIDLCHYYLSNDEERKIIAANGWKKVVKDYNEIAVFQRLINNIKLFFNQKSNCQIILDLTPTFSNKVISNSFNIIDTTKYKIKSQLTTIYKKINN